MTFESMIAANPNANTNEELLVLKIAYGDEMRRVSFNGGAYVALLELVAKLFELDPAAIVLKYQDADGDKITMSTDAELKDAIELAKEKLLRVFVELKPKTPAAVEETNPPAPAQSFCGRFGRGAMHGAFFRGPHPHGPHHGPYGHHYGHHGHHGRGGFPRFQSTAGFFAPGKFAGFNHHSNPACPAPTTADGATPVSQDGINATFHTPLLFSHGAFSPAANYPCLSADAADSRDARCAFKKHKHEMREHFHAMKEQIRLMKMNATTPEDFQAIKDFKEQMRAECKAKWHAMKESRNSEKECKKEKCDKEGKKEWKKCDKEGKKEWKRCPKEGKEWRKCEKKDGKRCKKDRPAASFVADVTIPDHSELPADTPVTKTWRLRNEGSEAWPADSQLIFLTRRGDNINGPERVMVGAVGPSQEVDVSVTFITPSETGRYIGFYRMTTAEGRKFGKKLMVCFVVSNAAATVPAVTTTTADVSMD